MSNEHYVYDDGEMKISVDGVIGDMFTTDELIRSMDVHQRIRILEFVSGMRNISEVRPDECDIVRRVLTEKIKGRVSPELDPQTWHLPGSYRQGR